MSDTSTLDLAAQMPSVHNSGPRDMPIQSIKAELIPIRWDSGLPIFAKEEFLKAVGDEYGWLGGLDGGGALRCILPYTIVRKTGLRMVRFRMETIPVCPDFDESMEKSFLNSVIQYFRITGADVIIPPSNNAIFR